MISLWPAGQKLHFLLLVVSNEGEGEKRRWKNNFTLLLEDVENWN